MNNNVLLEIGVEELPARFMDDAQKQLKEKMGAWLTSLRISYTSIHSYATPRRLALIVEGIADKQAIKQEEVRGPKVAIAKDTDGNWTKAAIGFSKSQGKLPEDMYVKKVKDIEYLFLEKRDEGKDTLTILPEIKEIIETIHFPQTMRWGETSFRFSRPIRWIVALYNQNIIPFEVAGVSTGNITKGHRFLGNEIEIQDPLTYEELLYKQYVMVDPKKREEKILEEMKQVEENAGFTIEIDQGLLQEVRNLIEYPTVFYGTFHEEYLQLPNEVLITSMKEHQRYFPVYTKDDATLLPYFVSVRNGNKAGINNVIKGNEKVLRARLADAAFFFAEDKKYSIEKYMDKLKTVIFQEDIGTIYEKSIHTTKIAEQLINKLDISDEIASKVLRTASIAKFDLVTSMVNEFTELQGIMGEKYATYFGEDNEVSCAIKEHYLPKQANGKLPSTTVGAIVSVADKLDTIISCFSAGLIPSGSQDPYGLRRQAIGVMRILIENSWSLNFEEIVSLGTSIYKPSTDQQEALDRFFHDRAAYVLQERGLELDVIHAVLKQGIQVFSYTIEKATILSKKRNDPNFKSTQEALVRILNLSKKAQAGKIEKTLFETESERKLYKVYQEVKHNVDHAQQHFQANEALQHLGELTDPIHAFFDHNMVMADNVRIKENRLALIHAIAETINSFAELSFIEWKQHQ